MNMPPSATTICEELAVFHTLQYPLGNSLSSIGDCVPAAVVSATDKDMRFPPKRNTQWHFDSATLICRESHCSSHIQWNLLIKAKRPKPNQQSETKQNEQSQTNKANHCQTNKVKQTKSNKARQSLRNKANQSQTKKGIQTRWWSGCFSLLLTCQYIQSRQNKKKKEKAKKCASSDLWSVQTDVDVMLKRGKNKRNGEKQNRLTKNADSLKRQKKRDGTQYYSDIQ